MASDYGHCWNSWLDVLESVPAMISGKNRKGIVPKLYEPTLAIIEYKEDTCTFYGAEVVLWNGNEWVIQFDTESIATVLYWMPLPKSIQNKIDKLYKEKK